MMQNRNESELCDLHKANHFRKNGLFTIHESKGKSEELLVSVYVEIEKDYYKSL